MPFGIVENLSLSPQAKKFGDAAARRTKGMWFPHGESRCLKNLVVSLISCCFFLVKECMKSQS